MQAIEVVAWLPSLYRPATHAVQPEVPVEIPLNDPAKQLVHTAGEAPIVTFPYDPAAQAVHKTEVDAAATVPYMPNEQPVQADAPVVNPL